MMTFVIGKSDFYSNVFHVKINQTLLAKIRCHKGQKFLIANVSLFFFSTGDCRDPYFNLIQISEWSLIFAGSNNAVEIGVIGSEDQQKKWLQWLLPDSGRAELPLKANSDERY